MQHTHRFHPEFHCILTSRFDYILSSLSTGCRISRVHTNGLRPGGLIGQLIGKFGNIFDDRAPTSPDREKWISPVDSQCQIGLETSSGEVLIVVGGVDLRVEKSQRGVTYSIVATQPGKVW